MLYVGPVYVEDPVATEDLYHSLEWWYDLDQPFVAHADLLREYRRYDTQLVAPDVAYDVSALLPRLPDGDYHVASYLAPPHG